MNGRVMRIVAAAAVLATCGLGQLNRGTLTGQVSDASGAVIPGARIEIVNTATQATYRTGTTGSGQYYMPNLPPGSYTISFEADGFKRLVRTGIQLEPTQVLRVDVVMEVGMATESVSVTAEVPRIQTETPEVATTMPGRDLLSIPYVAPSDTARVPDELLPKIMPGMQGDGWRTRINGTGAFTKETLLEGASVTTYLAGAYTENSVSMEALQEVKVHTSGVSAEFGRTQGGVINYTMKSGTNDIHGSAYAGITNEALDANTFVNNSRGLKKAFNRKSTYAASFGGPVYLPKLYNGKNKTFFYVTWERYSRHNYNQSSPSLTYPIPEFYQGDFSRLLGRSTGLKDALGRDVLQGAIYDPLTFRQLPDGRWIGEMFPGNKIPVSRFSKVAQNVNAIATKYYLPTVRDTSGQIPLQNNAYGYDSSFPVVEQHMPSVKVDQNISDRHKLSAVYSYTLRPRELIVSGGMWSFTEPHGGVLSRSRMQRIKSQLARVSYDSTITPHVLNHVNLSYNRMANPLHSYWYKTDGAAALGITGVHTDGYPRIEWGSGPYVSLRAPGYPEKMFEVYMGYGLRDTVSFATGRHFIKVGVDLRGNAENTRPSQDVRFNFSPLATSIPGEVFAGTRTGYSFASYLLGLVQSVTMNEPYGLGERRRYYALFVQDDFKVNSRLTLQLGLRWEYQPPFREAADRISSWDPTVRDPASGLLGAYTFAGNCPECTGRNYFGTKDWKDFGPRFGFAYRIRDTWSVRGAYAIMYEGDLPNHYGSTPLGKLTTVAWGGTYAYNPASSTPWKPIFNWDNGLPSGYYVPASFDRSYGNANGAGMVHPRYGLSPYIQQWNFNLQRQLPAKFTLDVGYLGNKGTRLRNGEIDRLNQLPASVLSTYGSKLTRSVTSAADAAAYGIAYPYPGFSGTVASALRPYPQLYGLSTVSVYASPLGFSTYHGLQVLVNRQFAEGLAVFANYVWSKNISNTSSSMIGDNSSAILDYYNLSLEKAVAANDQPHALKVYFSYELPLGRGKRLWSAGPRWLSAIISGWEVAGILNYFSGTPLGFSATFPLSGGWNGATNRPNIAPGNLKNPNFDKSKFNLADSRAPENTYLNKSLFSDPPPLTLGTSAPRYAQARRIGTINEDLTLQKSFTFRERVRWLLRAEALNAFNRSTLGAPNTAVNNALFGQITSISGNRVVQLVSRVDF